MSDMSQTDDISSPGTQYKHLRSDISVHVMREEVSLFDLDISPQSTQDGSQVVIKPLLFLRRTCEEHKRSKIEKKFHKFYKVQQVKDTIRLSLDTRMRMNMASDKLKQVFIDLKSCIRSLFSLDMNFYNCQKITNATLFQLSQILYSKSSYLEHLHLDLTLCYKITAESIYFFNTALNKIIVNLKSLSISFSRNYHITNQILIKLCHTLRKGTSKLQKLKLDFSLCFDIDDRSLYALSKMFRRRYKKLVSFEICAQGSKLTDKGLEIFSNGLAKGAHDLRELKLEMQFKSKMNVENTGLGALSVVLSKNFDKLERLRLDFVKYEQISDAGIQVLGEAIQSGLPNLKALWIFLNRNEDYILQDERKAMLDIDIEESCYSLQCVHINLTDSKYVTDAGIAFLAKSLQNRLEKLKAFTFELSECQQVSDTGIKMFSEYLTGKLSYVQSFQINIDTCLRSD